MSDRIGFFTNIKDGGEVSLWDDGTFLTLQAPYASKGFEVSLPYAHGCGYGQTIECAEMFIVGLNHALLLSGYCLKLVAVKDSGGIPAALSVTEWSELQRIYREEYEDNTVEEETWDTFVLQFCKL